MNPSTSQERPRTVLASPHVAVHPSTSTYSYGLSSGNSAPSGFGAGHGQSLNESIAQSKPHYQPGYLLSLAQSQAIPMMGQRHEDPLLIPTRAKMNPSYARNSPSDFGSDSMFEITSKHRHRETASDEDGPPTSSVVDLVSETYVDPQRQLRSTRKSASAYRTRNGPASPSGTPHQTLYVVVFGYPPSRYSSTLSHFQSIADGGTTDPERSLDVENAFKIGYKQPWEAARALRRNGEVISGEGGRWMVGVNWMDPIAAEQVLGSGAKISLSSLPAVGAETPISSPQDRMDVSPDSTYSQLQHVGAAQQESAPSVGTPIKLVPSTAAFRKATLDLGRKESPVQMHTSFGGSPAKSRGVLGQVSDLVFGW